MKVCLQFADKLSKISQPLQTSLQFHTPSARLYLRDAEVPYVERKDDNDD